MYEDYFQLEAPPFGTNPDPSFVFWSETHEQSFTMLRYGVMSSAQLTVVTGEIGAGKTTLVRHLLGELPEWITVGVVSNAQAGRGELLHWVLMALHLEVKDEPYVLLLERFQDHAVECFAAGRRLVLIFDEAQNLSPEMLEELRLLSNINADGDVLIQVILVGQPQLGEIIRQPGMVQFAQRVGAAYHLENLTASEVPHYVRHRLHRAGARREIFSGPACSMIAESTGGVPRLINVVCNLCLVAAQEGGFSTVDTDLVEDVLATAHRTHPFGQLNRLAREPRRVPDASPPRPGAGGVPNDYAEQALVLVNPIARRAGGSSAAGRAEPAAGFPRSVSGGRLAPHEARRNGEEFWVYENWISKRAVLHTAGCFYCNAGLGIGLGSDAPRGRWYGPFVDRARAERIAMVEAPAVRDCKICMGARPAFAISGR